MDQETKAYFFGLPSAELSAILDEYERRYGRPRREYATPRKPAKPPPSSAEAAVVMCDINDDDLGIDIAVAESLITPRTKAIIPLHFSGIPCRIAGVYALAKRHDLRVIEDGCHAFGSTVE